MHGFRVWRGVNVLWVLKIKKGDGRLPDLDRVNMRLHYYTTRIREVNFLLSIARRVRTKSLFK